MIVRFKKAPLFVLFFLLTIAFFTAVSIFAFKEKALGIAVLGIVADIIIIFAAWCRFFAYGLRISDKRVIAVEQSRIKIASMDSVSRITVKFTSDSITALIKTKDQNEEIFVWDGIFLGTHVLLPENNNVKLTPEFVEKSISELSKCDKVHIQNYFN